MRWSKETFLKDMRAKTSREITKIGAELCSFAEKNADEVSWGRGSEYGTISFKSKSDFGMLTLFLMTSKGYIKFLINNLRQREVPKVIIRDFLVKLESNFLRDYDKENYPVDTFEDMSELFNTMSQVEKFKQCIEGVAYRLRQ
ncbi:MAG: hypothetical protein IIB44_07250 [Candidatus Marinimicrobia bacterium]|nr:hypothetical protein [Candidatus Neomarinimicrobiota bacterium]